MADEKFKVLVDRIAEDSDGDSRWYYELITILTVLNRPDLTPLVYTRATEKAADLSGRQEIYKRTSEALLKAIVIIGQPWVMHTMRTLLSVIKPEEIPPAAATRDWALTDEIKSRGTDWFTGLVGPAATPVMNKLGSSFPDLAHYVFDIGGAQIISASNILSLVETQRLTTIFVIGQRLPALAPVHIKAMLAFGGTPDDAREAVGRIMAVADALDIKLEGVPNLEDVLKPDYKPALG